jgi:phosphate transport system permease protein
MGTIIAIYLSEFANPKVREIAKPVLELLGGMPDHRLRLLCAARRHAAAAERSSPQLPGFSLLSAGLVMGIMIVPYIASLSEDAMRAVPMSMREGAYAMGATKLYTAIHVVVPAAVSGMAAAYILAISRAVGETMILAVAAGMQPNLTWNPMEPAATITSYIVQVALGDLPHGSIGYQTIFAAGLTLLLITLPSTSRPVVRRASVRLTDATALTTEQIRAVIARGKLKDMVFQALGRLVSGVALLVSSCCSPTW